MSIVVTDLPVTVLEIMQYTPMRSISATLFQLALILTLANGCGTAEKSSHRVDAIRTITRFMQTGDTTNLRMAFADSVLADLSIDGMLAIRGDLEGKYGRLQEIGEPKYDSGASALLLLPYDQAILDVTLTFDSDDKVGLVAISVAPTWSATTDSSARLEGSSLTVIDSLEQFIRYFDQDTGYVRLIALLSPT